jgi:beta-glucosidase-like glycosyl hydrolase
VDGAARRFAAAGGDLALICRRVDARRDAVAAIREELERGAIELDAAVRRRRAARELVEAAGARPPLSVIGCDEHRALAEELAVRS